MDEAWGSAVAERDHPDDRLTESALAEIEAAVAFAVKGGDGTRRLSLAREALRRSEHLALARTLSRWIARNRARAIDAQASLEISATEIKPADD